MIVVVDKTKHVKSSLHLILFLTSFNFPWNFYIQIIVLFWLALFFSLLQLLPGALLWLTEVFKQ